MRSIPRADVLGLKALTDLDNMTLGEMVQYCHSDVRVGSACFESRAGLFALFGHLEEEENRRMSEILTLRADIVTPAQCRNFIEDYVSGFTYDYVTNDRKGRKQNEPLILIPRAFGRGVSTNVEILGLLPNNDTIGTVLSCVVSFDGDTDTLASFDVSAIWNAADHLETNVEFRTHVCKSLLIKMYRNMRKTLNSEDIIGDLFSADIEWFDVPNQDDNRILLYESGEVEDMDSFVREWIPEAASQLASLQDFKFLTSSANGRPWPMYTITLLFHLPGREGTEILIDIYPKPFALGKIDK